MLLRSKVLSFLTVSPILLSCDRLLPAATAEPVQALTNETWTQKQTKSAADKNMVKLVSLIVKC